MLGALKNVVKSGKKDQFIKAYRELFEKKVVSPSFDADVTDVSLVACCTHEVDSFCSRNPSHDLNHAAPRSSGSDACVIFFFSMQYAKHRVKSVFHTGIYSWAIMEDITI